MSDASGSEWIESEVNNCTPFVRKLAEFIEEPSSDNIVSWNCNGKSFVVWDPGQFASTILPKYFKHGNLSSFVRQLNQYGFHKSSQKRYHYLNLYTSSYEFSHELFQRDKPELWVGIQRNKPVGIIKDRRLVKTGSLICYHPVFGLPFVPEEYLLSDLSEILYRRYESLKDAVVRQKEENEILRKRLREYERELLALQAASKVKSSSFGNSSYSQSEYGNEADSLYTQHSLVNSMDNLPSNLSRFQSEEDTFEEPSRRDLSNFIQGNRSTSAFPLEEEEEEKFGLREEQPQTEQDSFPHERHYPSLEEFPSYHKLLHSDSLVQDSSSLRNLVESLQNETRAVLGKHERFESGSSSMLYFPKLLKTEDQKLMTTPTEAQHATNSSGLVTDTLPPVSSKGPQQAPDEASIHQFDFPRETELYENSQGNMMFSQDWAHLEKSMDELSANLSSMSFTATLAATVQQIEEEQWKQDDGAKS
eukprot:jgi/Galph1/4350/GphlegSOOS_G2952.1